MMILIRILIIIAICAFYNSAKADFLSVVVASVDGEPITSTDVSLEMGREISSVADLREVDTKETIEKLVFGKVVELEAKKNNISVTDADVDNYIQEIQRKNNIDLTTLKSELTLAGSSFEKYRNEVQFEILKSKIVAVVLKGISISGEEVEAYFNEHIDEFSDSTMELAAFEIPKIHLTDTAKEKITAGLLKLVNGEYEQFVHLAGEISKSLEISRPQISLVKINPRTLRSEIHDKIYHLKEKEVSKPVDLGYAWAWYFVNSVEHGDAQIGDKMRERIKEKLLRRKIDEKLEKMQQELMSRYTIDYKY